MKLHCCLDIPRRAERHLAHRLREADDGTPFVVPVEADETFVGGKARNLYREQRDRSATVAVQTDEAPPPRSLHRPGTVSTRGYLRSEA